ncbi:aspartate carbamoyltransferase catalytic subunit [Jeotgalibacillus sp. R-1-5s-1]|uniref:aspartate carbamoyltransferase catalytic subunit n=1 Tax=Jeotgalibacillus sp. R-1-5s-1 TaxID=2555897 RepID=UPI00106B286F|nr:aspartate carbamoyltransferase catalytic subunit [Jeotgalibacillus sp. R-1-5s-1]TFE03558.1 aspartate carbamoyltransferase catalytic subunit [Jeotgalibacillus sp. R-1-5s-1]
MHFLTMDELSVEDIFEVIQQAQVLKHQKPIPMPEKYAVNLFFENSTRTKCSFEMAQKKLGMNVLSFDPGTASVHKGESLYDTVKTLEAIGVDVAVIRHSEERYFDALKDHVSISLINGGDGMGHHPSQCMLDLLTIYQEFGTFEGVKVTIAGDIRHSRVARSNTFALKRLGADVNFTGPEQWRDPEMPDVPFIPMDEAVKTSDALMLLRVQHERHTFGESFTKEKYHQEFGLTVEREKRMKHKSIILHPAPVNRGVEIADELVECSRSRIFKQMENGVPTRMAMLQYVILKREELKHELIN